MSIENSLERIAIALEKITTMGMQAPTLAIGVPPEGDIAMPVGSKTATPSTPEALKKLAIEMAGKLTPDEAKNFTAYVRGFVCTRFGVQKLMEVPADQVEYAIEQLKAFDKTQDYSPKKAS